MYKLKLILRYLHARRITVIPVMAVTAAVFLLIVVPAVMRGFSSFIQGKIRGTLSDIIVEADDVRGFEGYRALGRKLSALADVEAVSPHLDGKAILTLYDELGEPVDFPCVFIGIDLAAESRASHLGDMIEEPKAGFAWSGEEAALPGMIVGNQVLQPYTVPLGFRAGLTTPTAADFGDTNAMMFRITARFKTGLYEYDQTTVYLPLADAQRLTRLEDRITSFHIRAKPGADLDALKKRIAAMLPPDAGLIVKTWREAQKVLIDAMALERIIWTVILSALFAVAGFCILAVMSMTVIQKTRDIGILRSLGASVKGILGTFIQYGLAVGLIGSTLGLALGFLLLYYLDPVERVVLWATGWTPWPRTVFYFDKIPRDIEPALMLAVWAGGILISFLAGIIPAARAARTDPVNTLRYEH